MAQKLTNRRLPHYAVRIRKTGAFHLSRHRSVLSGTERGGSRRVLASSIADFREMHPAKPHRLIGQAVSAIIANTARRGSSMAEQGTHKPLVVSSNLTLATGEVVERLVEREGIG